MKPLQYSQLDNGVRIITQASPGHSSAALGIWLVNGTRHQAEEQTGYAHLLEHLVFRKTARFSGRHLSDRFEAMGGQINAETGRELTAYHGLVPGQNLPELLDLFISMLTEPGFTDKDLQVEREVVYQELGMLHDDPEEELEDYASEQVWRGHPMGSQILGNRESLARASSAGMHDYLAGILNPQSIHIVACGNVDHDQLVQACKPLGTLGLQGQALPLITPVFQPATKSLQQDHEQTHLLWVMPAHGACSKLRACQSLANHMLAGGVSSFLYQKIREELGLVYSIHSRIDVYSDCGLWMIQTSTHPENTRRCIEAIEQGIAEWIRNGPDHNELEQAREHVRSSLILENDDLEASMEMIAREYIYLGKVPELEDRLREYDALTKTDLQQVLDTAWQQRAFFRSGPGCD